MKINSTYDEMTRDLDSVTSNISSSGILQKACLSPILEKYDDYIIYIISHQLKNISKETKRNRLKLWREFNELCKNKWKTPEMSLNDARSFYWVLVKDVKTIGETQYNEFNHELGDYIMEFKNPIVFKTRLSKFLWKIIFIITWSIFGLDKIINHISN